MAGRTLSGPTAQAPRNSAQASTPSRENIRASGAVAVMVAGIALADQNSRQMETSPQATGATVRGRAQPEADRNMTFLSVSLVWVDALAWGGRTAGCFGEDRAVRRFARCAMGDGSGGGFITTPVRALRRMGFWWDSDCTLGVAGRNPFHEQPAALPDGEYERPPSRGLNMARVRTVAEFAEM